MGEIDVIRFSPDDTPEPEREDRQREEPAVLPPSQEPEDWRPFGCEW